MDQQRSYLDGERDAAAPGLPRRGVEGDDNIAQHGGISWDPGPFTHGEGEHIGGPVGAAIGAIESVYLAVVDETDGQLGR